MKTIMEEEDEIRLLQKELNESAKIIGKGSEREYNLRATIQELSRTADKMEAFLLEHASPNSKNLILEYRKLKARRNI